MCAAIGCDILAEGPVAVSLGTSGTAFAYRSGPALDPLGEAAAFCDSTGGWLPLAATLNCTSATEWARELFAMDHPDVEAAVASGGAAGLAFLPYLSGERTPNRPDGTGVFVGLRAGQGRDAIVYAVVEGVTFGLAYALDALRRSGGVRTTTVRRLRSYSIRRSRSGRRTRAGPFVRMYAWSSRRSPSGGPERRSSRGVTCRTSPVGTRSASSSRTSDASKRSSRSAVGGRVNHGCQPSPAGPALVYPPTPSSSSRLLTPNLSVCRALPPKGHPRPRSSQV